MTLHSNDLEFDITCSPRSVEEVRHLRDEAEAVRQRHRRAMAVLAGIAGAAGLAAGGTAGVSVWTASSAEQWLGQDGRILLSVMIAEASMALVFSVSFAALAVMLKLIELSSRPGFRANDRLTLLAEVNSEDFPAEAAEYASLRGATPVIRAYADRLAATGRGPVLGELRAVRKHLESEQCAGTARGRDESIDEQWAVAR